MEKIDNSYYGYAENDSKAFKNFYNDGYVYNCMAAMAQNCCEKYLKHIIQEYDKVDTAVGELAQTKILKTHSIKGLLRYITDEMEIKIDRNLQNDIKLVDGYYFSARYPGDESFYPTKDNIDDCMQGIESCEKVVNAIIIQKENEKLSPIDLDFSPFEKITDSIQEKEPTREKNYNVEEFEL